MIAISSRSFIATSFHKTKKATRCATFLRPLTAN
nr:MAG TPA: hypothetical protein [Caudoviricetes sp.]